MTPLFAPVSMSASEPRRAGRGAGSGCRPAAPARRRAAGQRAPVAGRDGRAAARRAAAGDRHGQRRGARRTSTTASSPTSHWRHYTGHDYKNVSVRSRTAATTATTDVVCGNTSPGAAESAHPAVPADDRAGASTGCAPRAAAGTCRRRLENLRRVPLRLLRHAKRSGRAHDERRRRAARRRRAGDGARAAAAEWWPLAALIVLAAALRLATLDQQGFWYDEAFTPVHVLHRGLSATLRAVVHTENTPPLWYLLAWADARCSARARSPCGCPRRSPGSSRCPVVWAIGAAARRPARAVGAPR